MGFDRVFIIGFGQIGKSIANTLKINNFQGKIYASSRKKITNCNYIDDVFSIENTEINYNNSIIFICTPPNVVIEMIKKMLIQIKDQNCIISDVCSVKNNIFLQKNIIKNKYFIYIHTMYSANSTDKKYFFKKQILNYVINNNYVDDMIMKQFCNFLENFLNCKNELINYVEHDKIVAITSHIPNLILSIINSSINIKDNKMWKSILQQNRDNISKYLNDFIDILISSKTNNISKNYNTLLKKYDINIATYLKNPSLQNVLNIDNCKNVTSLIENLREYFNCLVL